KKLSQVEDAEENRDIYNISKFNLDLGHLSYGRFNT
ncbi:unnamed protein product, partial [marine sediment metagenome]